MVWLGVTERRLFDKIRRIATTTPPAVQWHKFILIFFFHWLVNHRSLYIVFNDNQIDFKLENHIEV